MKRGATASGGGGKVPKGSREAIPVGETPRRTLDSDKGGRGRVFIHWNVGGLNALLNNDQRKQLLQKLVREHEPHVLSLSEHKISSQKIEAFKTKMEEMLPNYKAHWAISQKPGYSGVVAFVRENLEHSAQIDPVCSINEGRVVTVELDDVFVVNAVSQAFPLISFFLPSLWPLHSSQRSKPSIAP